MGKFGNDYQNKQIPEWKEKIYRLYFPQRENKTIFSRYDK